MAEILSISSTFKACGDAARGFIIVLRDPLPGPFDFKNEAASTRKPSAHRTALAQILSPFPTLTPAEPLQLASASRTSIPETTGTPVAILVSADAGLLITRASVCHRSASVRHTGLRTLRADLTR